jgi:murein DD-endopeptidase MepM/ murein hydrolase activator NlpD
MTETAASFSGRLRAALVAVLLVIFSVIATVAGAAPPSREDVRRARDRLERIEDALDRIQRRLATTQVRLNDATADVERHQSAVERVTVELFQTQTELDRARARHDTIVDRLHERAVMAYMTGPASSVDFLLDADNVADLTDRLAYVDALAQADAELGVKVANLTNRLAEVEARLERERSLRVRALREARAKEREVASLFDQQRSLLAEQEQLVAAAERTFKKTRDDYDEWVAQQAAAQGNAIGGREWHGGSLAPFDDLFDVCPVAQPRAYGDGFGAPRYAGGYHLHKGVDIVAPMGAEIYAPFDGQAYTSSNALGGNVVFVVGVEGTVYNAHLYRYAPGSNGSVSAGEVIGYVGSTGSSTTPHDHFEFHPRAMPGSWFESAYGHGVIEDAINPYPMLLQACG